MPTLPGYSHEKNTRNPLYQVLKTACPKCVRCRMKSSGRTYYKRDDKNGHKSIIILAYFLKVTPWSVHKWINKRELPARRIPDILQIAEGRVSLKQLEPFVFKTTAQGS